MPFAIITAMKLPRVLIVEWLLVADPITVSDLKLQKAARVKVTGAEVELVVVRVAGKVVAKVYRVRPGVFSICKTDLSLSLNRAVYHCI